MKITISGTPGSGKSTVGSALADELEYDHYSTGDFMRRMARERDMTLDELQRLAENDPSIDEELDAYNKQLGKNKDNFILDSRLGFHFIPDAVSIYLAVDLDEAAQRIAEDSREDSANSIGAIKQQVQDRIASENERYKTYYDVYIHDEDKHDVVIDTTEKTPDEVVATCLDAIDHNL
jgi:predicted cytidylate kinase